MFATRNAPPAWLLAAAALYGVVGHAAAQRAGREPPRPEVRGVLKAVDAAGTLTVSVGGDRQQPAADKTYPLAKDVEVALGSDTRRGLFKEGKLADLAAGTLVALTLSADQKTVESILAEGPVVRGMLKAGDPANHTLTVTMAPTRRDQAAEEKAFPLAPDAEIVVDDGRGRRFSMKEGKPGDLTAGAAVVLRLSPDQKQVQSVVAEGPSILGTVKALDPAKHTVTLAIAPGRGGEAEEERTLALAFDALTIVDDGRGRRLSLREGKLGDVLPGSTAVVRLSVDQKTVTSIRAEGPSVPGLVKAVDPDKATITLAVRRTRGEEPEEKTWPVARDARVTIDGADAKLADIKVAARGPFAMVRLSLDQKTVQAIAARQASR